MKKLSELTNDELLLVYMERLSLRDGTYQDNLEWHILLCEIEIRSRREKLGLENIDFEL